MKTLLQKIFINTIALLLVSYLIQGIRFSHPFRSLLLAALVLAVINAFVRPFLKILFLPINVITLGLFGWFINVVILYLTTLIVPGFQIIPFSFTLLGSTFHLNLFLAYIAVSFCLNVITTATSWLIH